MIKSGVKIHSVDVACVPMNQACAQGMVVQEKEALETLSSRSSQPSVVDGHANDHNRVECCGKLGQQGLPKEIGQSF